LTRFERDTAVARADDGGFDARIDGGWWIVVGPNGGYLAAIVVRALEAALADPTLTPRSLTVHYLEPAVAGPARVQARVERSGRSLSTLSARLEQNGRLIALALAAFGRPRGSLEFQDLPMPEVAPPESLPADPPATLKAPTLRERFETRRALGSIEPGTSARAVSGGWLRLSEPQLPDPSAIAMFCDAWPPSIRQRKSLGPAGLRGVPTIDLTVHFRAPLPAQAHPDDFYLCVFRTQTARGGFLEEDGEIWTRDGVLLAQSRQLALLI
jgi:acyl-CoA thioesterase